MDYANGNWVNPSGTHDATYTGNVIYGWTATGWKTATMDIIMQKVSLFTLL